MSRKEKKNRQECTLQQAVQCTWTASSTPIWAYLDGSVVLDGLKLVNVELQFHRESNGHRRMIKEERKNRKESRTLLSHAAAYTQHKKEAVDTLDAVNWSVLHGGTVRSFGKRSVHLVHLGIYFPPL